jgi:glycine cleavage system H protein
LKADEVFGSVEAVKTVPDLFLPIEGEILELNEDLETSPEDVNNDPYEKGWMIKMKVSNPSDLDSLLTSDDYKKLIGE